MAGLSGRSSTGGNSRDLVDLHALRGIADRAVELQTQALAVLQACSAEEEPHAAVARTAGEIAGEYHRLWAWSLDFATQADSESLERRLSQLLMQHCQLLHFAIRFAFPKCRSIRTEQQRRAATGLGTGANELKSVRNELDMWITTLTPGP